MKRATTIGTDLKDLWSLMNKGNCGNGTKLGGYSAGV